ncbi:serine/arginine repetitive matrix protein 1-like [Palaemon carinicauda]|uniref:serine/arginine repetitive matrix protein 1-like n=1 Tax=Palaemon carinicauda TaxID=392227 RepID=UPI0035B58810
MSSSKLEWSTSQWERFSRRRKKSKLDRSPSRISLKKEISKDSSFDAQTSSEAPTQSVSPERPWSGSVGCTCVDRPRGSGEGVASHSDAASPSPPGEDLSNLTHWAPTHPVFKRAPVPLGQKRLAHNVGKSLRGQVSPVRPRSPARKRSPVPDLPETMTQRHPMPGTTSQRAPAAESMRQHSHRSPAPARPDPVTRHARPDPVTRHTRPRSPARQRSPLAHQSAPLAHQSAPSIFGSEHRKEDSPSPSRQRSPARPWNSPTRQPSPAHHHAQSPSRAQVLVLTVRPSRGFRDTACPRAHEQSPPRTSTLAGPSAHPLSSPDRARVPSISCAHTRYLMCAITPQHAIVPTSLLDVVHLLTRTSHQEREQLGRESFEVRLSPTAPMGATPTSSRRIVPCWDGEKPSDLVVGVMYPS